MSKWKWAVKGNYFYWTDFTQQLKKEEILKQIRLPNITQSHFISKIYKLSSPQVTTSTTKRNYCPE